MSRSVRACQLSWITRYNSHSVSEQQMRTQ